MKNNKTFLIFLLVTVLLGISQNAGAQVVTKRIIVGNSGIFMDPTNDVNLHLYDPSSGGSMSFLDTIHTESLQHILVEGFYAYVAAQDSIVKYNLITGSRVAATSFSLPSTIKMGLYEENLIVGNWYGAGSGNLRIYDKHTLDFLDSIPEIMLGAKDFIILDDTAYITQNHTSASWTDSAGFFALVDLSTRSFVRNEYFTNAGEDLGRLTWLDETIYALNANSNTISTYDIVTGTKTTDSLSVDIQTNPNGPQIVTRGSTAYFQFDDHIGSFDLLSSSVIDPNVIDTVQAVIVQDTVNDLFYLNQTDFFSYSQGSVFNASGSKTGSYSTGDSPEGLAVVYNYLPTAFNDSTMTGLDTAIDIPVLDNDEDDDAEHLVLSTISAPANGTATITGFNEINYDPNPGFSGIDSLQYAIADEWGDADTAWVFIEVLSVSSDEIILEASAHVYPNPFSAQVQIDWESHSQNARISLFDLQGSKILETPFVSQPDLSSVPAGIYFLRLTDKGSAHTIKLIKTE